MSIKVSLNVPERNKVPCRIQGLSFGSSPVASLKGRTPQVGNILVRSYLYPATVTSGVPTTTNIRVMDEREERKKGRG
jgi:hypothetical protein